MYWFKHYTSDRNELAAKIIKKQFGAAGYGIYNALLEVIGENVKSDNVGDWGHVDALHSIETLADECACSVDELQKFLQFCDEKKIFEKHDGRLYLQLIHERLDEYATKIKKSTRGKKIGRKSRQNRDTIPTKSGQDRELVGVVSGIEIEEEIEVEEKKNREIKKDKNQELIDCFNEHFKKSYQLTDKVRKHISNRRKLFTQEQLINAVIALSQDKFYTGTNDRGWVANPEYLFRSDENVDTALNKQTKKSKKFAEMF